ncbi:MAG: hypothetical protein ACYDC9_02620 [Dermatophilaceae bacterium]
MSSDTTQFDAASAETSPRAVLQNSLEFLTDWARQINERERGLGQERQASPGGPAAPRRPGLVRHFGRHR